MAAIGVVAAIAAVGLSAYEYANQPGMPGSPNLAAAGRAGVEANAQTLADQRRLEAAAQQGIATQYTTYAHDEVQSEPFVRVPGAPGPEGRPGRSQSVPYVPNEWQPGGKYYVAGQKTPPISYQKKTVHVPGGTATADFTGFGQGEVQGKIAQGNAQNIYNLQQKYGPGFIDEALKEEQLADPQGFAARQREYDLIKQEENATPDRPVAAMLDQQVAAQLKAGKGLDPVADSVLREAVGKAQAARGGAGARPQDAEQFAEPLTTGFQGEQRLSAAEQKALGWLTSGATPEDVEYRRGQQTLADLSSFVNNRTPESQFAALSGAQRGPAPYNPGTPLAQVNPNAGTAGQGAALTGWNTQLNAAENTANPWMAGLSGMLKAAGAASTLGSRTGG